MGALGLDLSDGYRSLRLIVRRQQFPDAELDWDRDALDATVEVETIHFPPLKRISDRVAAEHSSWKWRCDLTQPIANVSHST